MGKHCAGRRMSGHWKGFRCGSAANYVLDGENYCGVHLAMAQNEPERIKKINEYAKKKGIP